MKTNGKIETKYRQNDILKERGLIKEEEKEYYRGFQEALEWVLKED